MALKKGDFIEIEYEGRIEDGSLFDTTNEDNAKKEGIHREGIKYEPIIICIGERQMLEGLEKELVGKDIGSHEIKLTAENAFGKKDAKLIKLVPMSIFKKQGVKPMPGLQINADNMIGTVKTVSGGRVLVDFNMPLAGHDVTYKIDIKRIVTDDKEKVESVLLLNANLTKEMYKLDIKEGKATITINKELNLPEELKGKIAEEVKKIVTSLKDVVVDGEKPAAKKPAEKKSV